LASLFKHGARALLSTPSGEQAILTHEGVNSSLSAHYKAVNGGFLNDDALQLSIK